MDDDEDVPDGRFTARVLLSDGEQTPLGLLGIPDVQACSPWSLCIPGHLLIHTLPVTVK